MARRSDNKVLYGTFRNFLDLCLVQNKSLLWPDKDYWTIENLKSIKKHIIDAPNLDRKLSFEEKLQAQMEGLSTSAWAIMSDIYYVYFLPSTFITFEKKFNDISWAAGQGKIKPPSAENDIWEAQKNGFTRTGMKYHQKYSQFWLITLLAIYVKEHEEPNTVINNHQIMQRALDMLLDGISNRIDRAADMRHAMLYMAFPDHYERMISTQDKKRVIEKYGNLITGTEPSDTDEYMLKLRKILSNKYNKQDSEFDFYENGMKEEWRPKTGIPSGGVIKTGTGSITIPADEDSIEDKKPKQKEVTAHTEIQWLLLKLGSDMGLDLWVANNDRGKEVDGNRFADLPRLKSKLPINFDEVTNKTIELIDVLWIKGNAILAAFEIESTTSVYSGILRMADLIAMQPNINVPLYIVAPDDRRSKVLSEVNRPVFSRLSPPMNEVCRYISFSSLEKKVKDVAPVIKFLKPAFLEDFSESCDLEDIE